MNSRPQISGIYSITHIESGRRYVGSSRNIHNRWQSHRKLLAKGAHHSPHLQSAWAKYGGDAFKWEVLETCLDEPVILVAREQFWIDKFKKKLYNARKIADVSSLEWFRTEEGRAVAKEHGRKIKEWWESQEEREETCTICHKTFMTRHTKDVVLTCSGNCLSKARRDRGDDDVERTCAYCEKPFLVNKYKKATVCSPVCNKRNQSGLKPEDIIEICRLIANGDSLVDVGKRYGKDHKAIYAIVVRKTWPDIQLPEDVDSKLKARLADEFRRQKSKSPLTDEQVIEIRRRSRNGEPYCKIAPDYNTSQAAISCIIRGVTYKWVSDDPPSLPLT